TGGGQPPEHEDEQERCDHVEDREAPGVAAGLPRAAAKIEPLPAATAPPLVLVPVGHGDPLDIRSAESATLYYGTSSRLISPSGRSTCAARLLTLGRRLRLRPKRVP